MEELISALPFLDRHLNRLLSSEKRYELENIYQASVKPLGYRICCRRRKRRVEVLYQAGRDRIVASVCKHRNYSREQKEWKELPEPVMNCYLITKPDFADWFRISSEMVEVEAWEILDYYIQQDPFLNNTWFRRRLLEAGRLDILERYLSEEHKKEELTDHITNLLHYPSTDRKSGTLLRGILQKYPELESYVTEYSHHGIYRRLQCAAAIPIGKEHREYQELQKRRRGIAERLIKLMDNDNHPLNILFTILDYIGDCDAWIDQEDLVGMIGIEICPSGSLVKGARNR